MSNFKLSNYFIIDNKTKKKPKKTEILSLFDALISQGKDLKKNKYLNLKYNNITLTDKSTLNSFFDNQNNFSKKHIRNYYSTIETSSFNENSITDFTNYNNFKTRKKSSLKKSRQINLPDFKNNKKDSFDKIDLDFYLPNQKNMSQLSEILTHKKFNSHKFNDIKTKYYIEKSFNKEKLSNNIIFKEFIEAKTNEEILEEKDKFYDEDIRDLKIKHIILKFLQAKDNKLNQVQTINTNFFDCLENRVNFIYDSYTVPHLKNSFLDFNKLLNINKYPNLIEHGIFRYLKLLRYVIQRKKDNEYYEKEEVKLSKEEIEDDKNNYLRFKDYEDRNTKIYELDQFFVYKFTKYNGTKITNWKIKNCIYNAKARRLELEELELEKIKTQIIFKD